MRLLKLWGWQKPIESLEYVVKLNELESLFKSFLPFKIFSIFKKRESFCSLLPRDLAPPFWWRQSQEENSIFVTLNFKYYFSVNVVDVVQNLSTIICYLF